MKIIENETVLLPDGCRIKSFWVTKDSGGRIGKASGNLNIETREAIYERALKIVLEWEYLYKREEIYKLTVLKNYSDERDYLQEAKDIIAGKTMMLVEREHLIALNNVIIEKKHLEDFSKLKISNENENERNDNSD